MKRGRNDICDCGSGLKYKKCCYGKKVIAQVHDLELRRLQDTEKRLMPRLIRHAEDVFGSAAFDAAWLEFTEGVFGENFDPEDELSMAFLPWFLYNWSVTDDERRREYGLPASCPLHQSVATSFIEAKGAQLPEVERQLIAASMDRPFSFYQVESLGSRGLVRLLDLLTLEKTEVFDQSLAKDLEEGEMILASLRATTQGRRLPLGLFPWTIAAEQRPSIDELREFLLEEEGLKSLDYDQLIALEPVIVGHYLDLMTEDEDFELFDGDPYEVHFAVEAPLPELVQRLWSLDPESSEENAIEEAEYDQDGKIRSLEIVWLHPQPEDPTATPEDWPVGGVVSIEDTRVIGYVHSEAHAQALKLELENRLQGIGQFQEIVALERTDVSPR